MACENSMNTQTNHSDPQGTADVAATDLSHPALAAHPKLTNPYFHLIHVLHGGLEPAIKNLHLPVGSRLLDYGCSTMRHRYLFPTHLEYVGADLSDNPLADVALEEDGRVPQPAASFDAIFSTQVLEHVEDPDLYLAECRRLLKPGGELLLTTHGTFVFHPCPYDYWRWTHMGLQRTIEKAGFEVTGLQGLCGGLPTAFQLLQDVISPKLPRLLRPLLHAFIQSLMVITDRLYKPHQRLRNATFFLVTAKHPQ